MNTALDTLAEARELYAFIFDTGGAETQGDWSHRDPKPTVVDSAKVARWLTTRDALRDQQVKAEALEEEASDIRILYCGEIGSAEDTTEWNRIIGIIEAGMRMRAVSLRKQEDTNNATD